MRWSRRVVAALGLVTLITAFGAVAHGGTDTPTGLIRREAGTYDGYTLYAPLNTTDTYLIDMDGAVVHQWPGRHRPGNGVDLLPDGTLLRTEKSPKSVFRSGRGRGGIIEQIGWDGKVRWRYEYATRDHLQHHDVEPMPDGNVLLLAWERHTRAEAIARGRDPALLPHDSFWSEKVVEIDPRTDEIVWEWRVWDHLVQDRDPRVAGFGVVADSPGRMDVNFPGGPRDWLHANSVKYSPDRDEIVLSLRRPSEVWVIDHSLTTREARGRAGDLRFRWGNPAVYHRGTADDRQLFDQHDAEWIAAGLPGAGNILVFNNGDQGVREYTTVDEITPVIGDGAYQRADDGTFLPERLTTVYPSAPEHERWWSGAISGAQRLPNGNTLIVDGPVGRLFEVTASGQKVWEYVNPFQPEDATPGRNRRGEEIVQWRVFDAQRFGSDDPAVRRVRGS